MSPTDSDRKKLSQLADAVIDDIVSASDAEILAEVDFASISQARTILIEAKACVANRLLADAKAQLDAWRSAQATEQRKRSSTGAEGTFQKFRRDDPAFNQHMTIAARKGKAPTDRDKEGLDEDWADLQQFEGQGKNE